MRGAPLSRAQEQALVYLDGLKPDEWATSGEVGHGVWFKGTPERNPYVRTATVLLRRLLDQGLVEQSNDYRLRLIWRITPAGQQLLREST